MRAAVLYFPRWHQHEWISLCHNEKDSIFGIVVAIALAKSKCFLCHLDAAKVIRMVTHTMYGMTYAEKHEEEVQETGHGDPRARPRHAPIQNAQVGGVQMRLSIVQTCSSVPPHQRHRVLKMANISEGFVSESYQNVQHHMISHDFIRFHMISFGFGLEDFLWISMWTSSHQALLMNQLGCIGMHPSCQNL